MLADSNLLANLQVLAFSPVGDHSVFMETPSIPFLYVFKHHFGKLSLMPQMEAYNSSISSVRSSVEWLFGDIVNYFKFIDF